MKSDIQIARECELNPIGDIASQLGIDPERIEPYGRYMAKVPVELIDEKHVKKKPADPGDGHQPDEGRYR